MFAKLFSQIYDSSIVENPSARFTFMDLLVLADRNGVVDMTHEAIARRTNRPVETIRKTILELEGPDARSRTPDCNGARLKRLDDHRDWGWMIVNYNYFRAIASEEQRREKTLARVNKHRGVKPSKSTSVTLCNALKRKRAKCNDSPSLSASASESAWIEELKQDSAYKGIDVVHEHAKAIRWYKENKRTLTRRAFINWLNRADRKLDGTNKHTATESGRGLGTANEGKSAQYEGVGQVR